MSIHILSLKLNKPLLYGAAAVLLLLVILLFVLLGRSRTPSPEKEGLYYPGIYSTSVSFGTQILTVEMTFSETAITSVSYQIPDGLQTVYPLVGSTLASIGTQLQNGVELEAVSVDSASSETGAYLKDAMALTIRKAMRKSDS